MPASTDSPERHSARLPTALLWAGVGVAPLAALALLIGSGERSLRAAIGLALLAVVLIGLSIVLRPAPDSVKVELEDTIYDEIDVVREDVRNDIATAARATHRAFAERFQHLQDTVEQLRGTVEALRGELARQEAVHGASAPAQHAGPRPGVATVPTGGVVRHTETVQVTTRSTIVDPHGEEPAGWPTAGDAGRAARSATPTWVDGRPAAGRESWRGPDQTAAEPATYRSSRSDADDGWSRSLPQQPAHEESWTEQQLRKRLAEKAEAEAAHAASADPRIASRPEARHGRAAERRESLLSRDDAPAADRWSRRADTPTAGARTEAERAWGSLPADGPAFRTTEPFGRHEPPTGPAAQRPAWTDAADLLRPPHTQPDQHRRAADQPVERDGDRWSGVRAADRWAALRSDEHGRELRMGERRASVHADETGSEVRIEDRWAAIRRDEPRAGSPAGTGRHDRNDQGWDADRWPGRDADYGRGWDDRDDRRRALPAASDEPSAADWINRWSPEQEPERRPRYRDDY